MSIFHVDFYSKDWLLKTQRLSIEERGVFIQVVAAIYEHQGPVDNDAKWLSNLCNCSVRKLKTVLSSLFEKGFLVESEGKITQKRAEEELQKANQRRENSSKNARKLHENSTKVERKLAENERVSNEINNVSPASYQSPITNYQKDNKKEDLFADDFETFWKAFPPQRKGSREKTQAAYRSALNRAPPETILAGVMAYAKSDEVAKGFAKGAAAWLNDDRWTVDYSVRVVAFGKASQTKPIQRSLEEAMAGYEF